MTSITYVGMDVHTTNFTLCCYSMEEDRVFAEVTVEPKTDSILKYLERVKKERGDGTRFLCSYEASCLGYSLYLELQHQGIDCVILAPSTMGNLEGIKNKQHKNDRRDAKNISKCLAFHTYSAVYVPTELDDAVKEYIRMRDDVKDNLKKTKQQIIAFCTRHGKAYEGKSYWTNRHLDWLRHLEWNHSILKETLEEYLVVLHFYFTKNTLDKCHFITEPRNNTLEISICMPGSYVFFVSSFLFLDRFCPSDTKPAAAFPVFGGKTAADFIMDSIAFVSGSGR